MARKRSNAQPEDASRAALLLPRAIRDAPDEAAADEAIVQAAWPVAHADRAHLFRVRAGGLVLVRSSHPGVATTAEVAQCLADAREAIERHEAWVRSLGPDATGGRVSRKPDTDESLPLWIVPKVLRHGTAILAVLVVVRGGPKSFDPDERQGITVTGELAEEALARRFPATTARRPTVRLTRRPEAAPDPALEAQAEEAASEGFSDAEIAQLRAAHPKVVGESVEHWTVLRTVERFAPTVVPVLILGESGTGKEGIARAFHEASGRKGAFVPVNVGGVADSLVEDVLFGHKRGAFTGADADTLGMIRAAEGGTLFLDEIGDASPRIQTALLRPLQENEVLALGSQSARKVDFRVIAATNKPLRELVATGVFREDLFHRLNGIELSLTPLRERPQDLRALVPHLLERFAPGQRRVLAPEALEKLERHLWPGNVRELAQVIQRACVLAKGPIGPAAIALDPPAKPRASDAPPEAPRPARTLDPKTAERLALARRCQAAFLELRSASKVAERLGLHRTTVSGLLEWLHAHDASGD